MCNCTESHWCVWPCVRSMPLPICILVRTIDICALCNCAWRGCAFSTHVDWVRFSDIVDNEIPDRPPYVPSYDCVDLSHFYMFGHIVGTRHGRPWLQCALSCAAGNCTNCCRLWHKCGTPSRIGAGERVLCDCSVNILWRIWKWERLTSAEYEFLNFSRWTLTSCRKHHISFVYLRHHERP